jgi:hypothetical protein
MSIRSYLRVMGVSVCNGFIASLPSHSNESIIGRYSRVGSTQNSGESRQLRAEIVVVLRKHPL